MDPVTVPTSKLDRTRRLVALGRRYLLEVDTAQIDVAELTRFVTTWRSAFDEPMSATGARVDELAAMIATARPQSHGLHRPFEQRPLAPRPSPHSVNCRCRRCASQWWPAAVHRPRH